MFLQTEKKEHQPHQLYTSEHNNITIKRRNGICLTQEYYQMFIPKIACYESQIHEDVWDQNLTLAEGAG